MNIDLKEKEEMETNDENKKRRSFIEPKNSKTKSPKKKRDKNNLVSTTIELEPDFRMQITKFYKSEGFSTLKDFFEFLVKKEMNLKNNN